MILSKTLDPPDYEELGHYAQHVKSLWHLPRREEHPHRRWEYSIAFKALHESGARTVLDVGGGGSLLAPILTCADMDVIQIDPADNEWLIVAQCAEIGRELDYIRSHLESWESKLKFDAVTCISVLEHVLDDLAMFRKLLAHAIKIVVVTVDFSPSGRAVVGGHLRTYNEEAMRGLIEIGKEEGFAPLGNAYDYSQSGNHVNGYNFASLVLKKLSQ